MDDGNGTDLALIVKENSNVRNEKLKNVNIEDALEYTGFGKYNIYLILVCGICLFAANIESYSVGYILPAAECDLKLDAQRKGILTSATFFGVMASSVFWGYLSDRKGRRNLLLITLGLSFLTSASAALTSSFWGFTILRFLTGVCISAPSSIVFAYFGEFQSEKNRSKGIAFISVFISLVLITLPCLGWLLLPKTIDFNLFGFVNLNSWRLFMFLNAIPNLLSALLFYFFPESPKFLYHQGKLDEAKNVLRSIYEYNTGLDNFPIDCLDYKVLFNNMMKKKEKNMFQEMWHQVMEIFKPPTLKYILTGCFLQAGVYAISCGLFLWYPDIINQLAKNKDNLGLTVCKALTSSMNKTEEASCNTNLNNDIFIQNIIIGFSFLIGYLSWGFFVRLLGNRLFFVLSMAVSSLGISLICFTSQKILIDGIFIIILTLPGVCIALICAIIVDVIPSHLCGMAICITLTGGRLGSIITSTFVGILLESNCTGTFILFSVLLLLCMGLAFVYPKK